jgi:hypothetical protein
VQREAPAPDPKTGLSPAMASFPNEAPSGWDAIISYDDFLNGKNVEIITWDQLSEKIAEGIV